jgi:two-component system chemotaxis response regulator CheB
MPAHDIITIGASAGGVEALRDLVTLLPADLPAAIFVVVHVPANSPTVLPQILSRRGRLPAETAVSHQPIAHGRIYVAPPDHHLLVKRGHVSVARGPRENGHRPAVDPLFRSAAAAYGARTVGVVLSGNLDDGAAGLAAIKRRRGIAIVQDPAEALYPGMPASAIASVQVDHVLPIQQIATLLSRLASTPVAHAEEAPMPDDMDLESEIAELKAEAIHNPVRPGTPSAFACPECGGALFELGQNEVIRFRCRTGHAFSPDTLFSHQDSSLENSLWVALRALEESAALSSRLAERAHRRGHAAAAERFTERARASVVHAEHIRRMLLRDRPAEEAGEPSGMPPAANEPP